MWASLDGVRYWHLGGVGDAQWQTGNGAPLPSNAVGDAGMDAEYVLCAGSEPAGKVARVGVAWFRWRLWAERMAAVGRARPRTLIAAGAWKCQWWGAARRCHVGNSTRSSTQPRRRDRGLGRTAPVRRGRRGTALPVFSQPPAFCPLSPISTSAWGESVRSAGVCRRRPSTPPGPAWFLALPWRAVTPYVPPTGRESPSSTSDTRGSRWPISPRASRPRQNG